MTHLYHQWPRKMASRYRRRGYWLDRPLTHSLEQRAATCGHALAVICGEREISYAELNQQAGNLAARLIASGLRPGDTALVQLSNVAEFYAVFFALLKAGIVAVNALFSHRRLELYGYADQVQPKLLIAARSHELFSDDRIISKLRQRHPELRHHLLLGEGASEHSLEHWLNSAVAHPPQWQPTAAGDVAFFQLSGGSTGTPKLIPRTHNDYDYSVRASAELCALSPQSRYLCALPAGHNFPLSSPGALGVFHAGGCVVMASSPEPLSCFALIERHAVTMTALVPAAVALWLQAAPNHRAALRSLRLLQVGGASFAEAQARQVPSILGCALQQVFGMAEGLVNYTRLDDDPEVIFTTQGRPLCPDDEVRIVDEQGQQLPTGTSGILAVRGPYTFCGYFKSPAHNARVFDDEGFYHSGDLVLRDANGNVKVVGRMKDQINRGGEKIAAEEIEHLLLQHPAITQAAVVAQSDPALGEKSCAFVVSSNPSPSPPLLRRFLLELGIAAYKLPDHFHFLATMPLTAVGKIDKHSLRERLAVHPFECEGTP
ncbi:MAG: (2,3-dihydroxybenzoyl)adenylate synthase [Gammaproteobacteria bacterium]|nr:(2,3-dihydroxybenzoyl)adenylate synthase [Gammaproteobacteria bacterium]